MNALLRLTLTEIRKRLDVEDLVFLVGLAAATYGLASWSIPGAWVFFGIVLMVINLFRELLRVLVTLKGTNGKGSKS